MKVKELIEQLKKYPQDMEVYTYGESVGGNEFECLAYKAIPHTKYVVEIVEGRHYIAQRPCDATKEAKKAIII